jgi:hypothetical protein
LQVSNFTQAKFFAEKYAMENDQFLRETRMLDYSHPSIVQLVNDRQWKSLSRYDQIGAAYAYVQNEIAFGYNTSDDLPASEVLRDGYGQCNTKGVLLMALLRSLGVRCRFHGFTIDKKLQKGAISGLAYLLAPTSIIHSWVEVFYGDKWINLEGFILDHHYLASLQKSFPEISGAFCGYGVATNAFKSPPIQWQGQDTYIQKEGINQDYGVFESPDAFYAAHGTNLSGVKRVAYEHIVRKWMNAQVSRIRNAGVLR